MSEQKVNLATRTETGKQVAKKLRREGRVPGVYYHHGDEIMLFSIDRKELQRLLGQETTVVDITFDGKSEKKCIIREVQFDPLTNQPIHVDLMGVTLTEKITVDVPIHLMGTPKGVKDDGGVLQHHVREIEIECLPTDIPEHIEVDVSHLKIGDVVHASDISVEKVKILADPETVIANVVPPRVVETVAVEAEEGEEAAEPEVVGKKEEGEEEGE